MTFSPAEADISNLKLLFVSNLYPPESWGGYEEVCLDVATSLVRKGHQVVVLCNGRGETGVDRGVIVRRALTTGISWDTRKGPLVERHNAMAVKRAIQDVSPDAVVCWNGGKLGNAFLHVAERMSCTVYYLHDTWLEPLLKPVFRNRNAAAPRAAASKRAYHTIRRLMWAPLNNIRTDRFVFNSGVLLEEYQRSGAQVRSDVVIPNGVPHDLFKESHQHILSRSPGAPPRILFVGRVVPAKGVGTLIRGLARLRRMPGRENSRLTVLGDFQTAAYQRQIASLIQSLGLVDSIDFIGHRPRGQVPRFHAQHDILAFPSEWNEPFGLSLLEGMACGIPVVASLRGAPGQWLRDRENAIAFEAEDPDDFAAKIDWCLSHPEYAARIGRTASAEVRKKYSLSAQADALEKYVRMQMANVAGTLRLHGSPPSERTAIEIYR